MWLGQAGEVGVGSRSSRRRSRRSWWQWQDQSLELPQPWQAAGYMITLKLEGLEGLWRVSRVCRVWGV